MDLPSEKYMNRLIAGKILGILTEKEEEELRQGLVANKGYRELYERLQAENYREEREAYIRNLQVDEQWEHLKTACLKKKHSNGRRLLSIWTAAASIVVLVTVGWLWLNCPSEPVEIVQVSIPHPGGSKAVLITGNGKQYVLQDTSMKIALNDSTHLLNDGKQLSYSGASKSTAAKEVEINTVIVPRGGEYKVVLPDNTTVYLNADSKLRYPVRFGEGKRVVEIEGEAFFQVSKDKEHPFVVRANNRLDIEVLGTEFNVTAYPEEALITTTLNEGAVQVSDGTQEIRLRPNQQVLFSKAEGAMKQQEVEAWIYSAWTEGRIILRNVSLEDLMNKLCRWYDLQLDWQDEQVKSYHFSGEVLRYENFPEILSMLEKATFVRFEVTGNRVCIRKR